MRKLPEASFALASFATNRWCITVDDGTSLDDVLHKDYWTNVARKLRPCDTIDVHDPEGRWYAVLYVRAASRFQATVELLNKYEFQAAAVPVSDDGLTVKYRGPKARYGVIRANDGTVVRDGFQTDADAVRWLVEHRQGMKAA